nr:uncharacterized protein LOC119166721 [Rhipicephalus microplus]
MVCLLVGEGDFSFALAWLSQHPEKHLVASCPHGYSDEARANVDKLNAMGVTSTNGRGCQAPARTPVGVTLRTAERNCLQLSTRRGQNEDSREPQTAARLLSQGGCCGPVHWCAWPSAVVRGAPLPKATCVAPATRGRWYRWLHPVDLSCTRSCLSLHRQDTLHVDTGVVPKASTLRVP